jgi:predicted helicase
MRDLRNVATAMVRTLAGVEPEGRLARFVDLALAGELPVGSEDLPALYEQVLAKLAPDARKARGVYTTPPELVDFVVRSADQLLRDEELGLTGIADHRAVVLDPACGGGAFLLAARSAGVLPTRLFGFEIDPQAARLAAGLSAATVVAGNPLAGPELGERFVERVKRQALLGGAVPVVLGNPPFRGHSANPAKRGAERTWIARLVDLYKVQEPELRLPGQAKWLQDDYVKFLRFGQWLVELGGTGVLCFVTNHAWIDNPTFRGLRKSLLRTFDRLVVLDLHGNENRKEQVPSAHRDALGTRDEGVFAIRQGTAVVALARVSQARRGPRTIVHGDLWGTRERKLATLGDPRAALSWTTVTPAAPAHLFVPVDDRSSREYARLWPLADFFEAEPAPGAVTTHDRFAIALDEEELEARIGAFLEEPDEAAARLRWRLCRQSQWSWRDARAALATGAWRSTVGPILHRPFDERVTAWDRHVTVHRRARLHDHVLGRRNVVLLTVRALETAIPWEHVFVTSLPIQHHTLSMKEVTYAWPLYRYGADGSRTAQISQRALEAFEAATGLHAGEGRGDLENDFGPEDVLAWLYAVLWSRPYRERYDSLLRRGFPRVPTPGDRAQLRTVAAIGQHLVAAHLGGLGEVPEDGPDESDLAFTIGGRRVLQRFLEDRPDADEAAIAVRVGAIRRTRALQQSLDAAARVLVEAAR